MGKVYIVGAGPGDPELLTIKALKVLKKADVVLYDRLVNKDILDNVKPDCKLVYVGKADGKHILEQDKINSLLYQFANEFEVVVRLKGGDPFVFGRGGEEAIFLKEHGIQYEVIPGITSAIAVPIYAGVPITQRGLASSFVVLTGHGSKGVLPNIDWTALKGIDTIIFLMGVSNRVKIAQNLIKAGKSPKTPVIFIEKGTTKYQREVEATLKDVADGLIDVSPPAIFLIGEVVKIREKVKWLDNIQEIVV